MPELRVELQDILGILGEYVVRYQVAERRVVELETAVCVGDAAIKALTDELRQLKQDADRR